MDIGILGWWRYDNQGDFRILDNLMRALAPHRVVPIELPFLYNEDVLQRLNLLDFLIVGGGGLFQEAPPPPFDTFDAWGRQLETPLGLAGVGIDEVLPEYRPLMSALVEQARFFYVRDSVSQQLLGHPKVQVVPDLTFLYPLDNAVGTQGSPKHLPVCGINLRQTPGLEVSQWVEVLHRLPVELRGIPFSTFRVWHETKILERLDKACATAFDLELYQGLDLMVGTAFHSVVFAIQAGVPVIAIAYAPKVRRLMTDIRLQDYLLEPDEWIKLPELVERVLNERGQLVSYLREITIALTKRAWQAMAGVRQEIDRTTAKRLARSGPRVSIVVVGSESDSANRTTLVSGLSQTYEDVELVFVAHDSRIPLETASSAHQVKIVPDDPTKSLGERLNCGFAQATGEYLSWTVGGNVYARDAIACMVNRLQQKPTCDMVYTDYYTIHTTDLIADAYSVDSAHKLFRRDVVGPCYLYRRKLGEAVGSFRADTPLAAYDYWLRAHEVGNLQPMHLQLFYALVSNVRADDRQAERQTRRQWRSNKPWLLRVFWTIVDTGLIENLIVRPLLFSRRRAMAFLNRLRQINIKGRLVK